MKYSQHLRIRRLLCATILASTVLSAAAAPEPGRSAPARVDVAGMEQAVQDLIAKSHFMGAVLVARGDDILFSKGYGFANLEWQIPNSPTTRFRLGSLTKQFTAASILLLQERGKLNLDDPVKKYLPDAPAAWDKVSFRALLTHTAGMPEITRMFEFSALKRTAVSPEQLIALFRDKPLDFQPGESMRYSNSGYMLLGYLIERISGKSYAEFVQDNIFTPLGMKDSGYDSNSAILPRRASGYEPAANGYRNAQYTDMRAPYSAGGLYSTTEDLLRWERALFGGKLLSPASLQEMTTPPPQRNYAFGLMIGKGMGHRVIEHGGAVEGFTSALVYYPDDQLTIAVLANVERIPPDLNRKLAALALPQE